MNKNTTERLWAAAIAMLIGLTLTLALGGCASMPSVSYTDPVPLCQTDHRVDCDPEIDKGDIAKAVGLVIATGAIVYIIAKLTDNEKGEEK